MYAYMYACMLVLGGIKNCCHDYYVKFKSVIIETLYHEYISNKMIIYYNY